ncbi:MAG: 50S ribosomal protein L25/general stress protein Ctc [Gammaproteobacteria bacterium]|nr:50S ribosomal protein L25/general stress protein Ctc [Gammaproteobacteria bacterium]
MSDFILSAEFRDDLGKGASRRLRRSGKVPAILYGGDRPPRCLSVQQKDLVQMLGNEAFYSSVISLKVGDNEQPAILKALHRHPAKPQILHLDLQRVRDDVEIRMSVPLHFLGGTVAVGVKAGGSVNHIQNELEIVCLPKFLPEFIEVDVSNLGLDEVVKLSEVKLPEGVALAHPPTEENDAAVVSIHKMRVHTEVEDVAEVADAATVAVAPKAE